MLRVLERARLVGRAGLWRVTLDGGVIGAVEASAGVAETNTQNARLFAAGVNTFDCDDRLLIPGFVDCHTHACWAGDRFGEWSRQRAGVPYLQILAEGGGIMSTVRAVRAASEAELAEGLVARLNRLLHNGTTTVEVKSGYGLTVDDELKMLRAIRRAAAGFAGTVIPTALLGHALDPDVPRQRFVRSMIDDALPRASEEFPGIAIDAFCEQGAWSVEECEALFRAAAARGEGGHPIRVHADQFNSLGMTPLAVALGARSVDHLEASTAADFEAIATSAETFGVGLPACAAHLGGKTANLTALAAKAPDRVCLASNLNPGSSPCWSMALVVALGVRHAGLTPGQALEAVTSNPARLLGLRDRGAIEVGQRADLVLVEAPTPEEFAWGMGDSAVRAVWANGVPVRK